MESDSMRDEYHIRRKTMYSALAKLGVPIKHDKLELGYTAEFPAVELNPGWNPFTVEGHQRHPSIIVRVRVKPHGVANRVQVLCPCCHATWVRFGCLQQHAQSAKCVAANAKRLKSLS
jgi:hypothetical protein